MNHVVFSFFLLQIDWRVMSQDTIWYSDMSSSAGMSNWTKPSGNCEFRFVTFDLFCPTYEGDCFVQCETSSCPGGISTNGYIYRIIPTTGYKDIYLEYTMCTFGDCRIYYNQNNQGNSNWIQFFSKNEQDQCDNPNTWNNKYYLPNSADNNSGVGIKFKALDGVGDDCCSYEHIALKGTPITNSPTISEPTMLPTTITPTTGSPTTFVPTLNPSKNPTTGSPTTLVPTYIPTSVPTTSITTSIPSMNPTNTPTSVPITYIPSYNPSNNPTQSPTSTAKVPTLGFGSPTIAPTVSTSEDTSSATGLTAITATKLTKTINTPNEQSISIFIYLGVGVGAILCILNAILCIIFAIKRKKKQKQKQKNNLKKSQDFEQKSIMMVSTDVLQKPQANINTNGANNLSMDDDVDDIRNDDNIFDDIELIGNIAGSPGNDDTPSTNEDNLVMEFNENDGNIVTKGNIDGYNDNINTESEGTGTQSPTDDIMVSGKRNYNTFGNMVDDEFIVNDDSDDNINVTSQKTLGKIQSDEFIINGDNDDDDLIVCINDTTTSRQ